MKLIAVDDYRLLHVLSVLEYIVVFVLLLGGFQTALSPPAEITGYLSFLGTKAAQVSFGVAYFCVGLGLVYGKVTSSPKWHSISLWLSFVLMFFSFVLEVQVFKSHLGEYIDTLVLSIITGGIYLHYYYYRLRKRYHANSASDGEGDV